MDFKEKRLWWDSHRKRAQRDKEKWWASMSTRFFSRRSTSMGALVISMTLGRTSKGFMAWP
jgi:hypothetical protein